MSRLNPRESGEYIVKNAKYLKVDEAGIEKLTKEIIAGIKSGKIDIANFSQHELHPKPDDKNAIEWIFVVDTLNFCFWTPINHTKYKVQGYTGYFALCAAVNRAIGEGYNLTDAAFYAKIDVDTLKHIFRSDDGETMVPLFEKRLECLHEVGQRLLEKWQGKFENVVKAANKSAMKLVELVVSEFPCFRDEAHYAGQRVALYKRAQILVGDLWACYRGEKMGEFKDIQSITMFADYRIPQVLVHFGTIVYGDGLMARLKKEEIMQNGEAMEVELRGASIYVVERVKDAVLAELTKKEPKISTKNVNAILIDHFLWDYRREHAAELEYIPFHKVLSVYY